MDQNGSTAGQDAFLDIVANLVGIVIILVVVVGANAATTWNPPGRNSDRANEIAATNQAIEKRSMEAANLQLENAELHEKEKFEAAIVNRLKANRQLLLVATQELESQVEAKQKSLDFENRERVNLLAEIQNLNTKMDGIRAQSTAIEALAIPKKEVIQHYPTPIAKTVFSDEVHFQINRDKIAYVPMEELVTQMKNEWKPAAEQTESPGRAWFSVGPLGPFRMRYLLEIDIKNHRKSARLVRFEFEPVWPEFGEDVDFALQGESQFKRELNRFDPQKTTVSLWVYPNAYEQMMEIRSWLRKNKYQTACWPLKAESRISGGPNGFRTTAN